MSKGKLAVITGPSGVGKDTLAAAFLKRHTDWVHPISTTTRDPKHGEVDGEHMHFVDEDTFLRWREEGKFLESFQVHHGKWYGTLLEPVTKLQDQGKNVLLRIDVQGALEVKKKIPETITVIITPESLEILEMRRHTRGTESPEHIKERTEDAKRELALADQFDHIIVNETGKQDEALAELERVLTS